MPCLRIRRRRLFAVNAALRACFFGWGLCLFVNQRGADPRNIFYLEGQNLPEFGLNLALLPSRGPQMDQ